VVLSHLSPGLTNASTGVANAALDSIPMVVIAGDVPAIITASIRTRKVNLHADASQYEIYRPFVKRAWRVDSPHLFPEIIEKAFALAESGRPGPCWWTCRWTSSPRRSTSSCSHACGTNTKALKKPSLDDETAGEIIRALLGAKTPLLYVGGGILLADAATEMRELAEHLSLPVAHSLMGKGALPDDHPLILGMSGFWGRSSSTTNAWAPTGSWGLAPNSRGGLQLVGGGVHFQIPADQADPHRHRSSGARQELSVGNWRRCRPQAGAAGA
jgi:acetolactate synthase-1/2/3 large subunit